MFCLLWFQWCVVGDTYPLGCAFSRKIVFGHESFKDCSDWGKEIYRYVEHKGLLYLCVTFTFFRSFTYM